MYKIGNVYTINGIKHMIIKPSYAGCFRVFAITGGIYRTVFTGSLSACKQYLDDYKSRSLH